MTGLLTLLRLQLRNSWGIILLLPVAVSVMLSALAGSVMDLFVTQAERDVYAQTVGEFIPSIALNGRGYDLTSSGGIVSQELGIVVLLVLPILSIHLAVSLTRGVEDTGQLDLLTAGRVSRAAPAGAGMLLGLVAVLVMAVSLVAGLVVLGLPSAGSIRYAAALAGFAAAHLSIGWVAAQLSRSARTAYAAAAAVTLVAYLVRLVVDVRQWEATWISPAGWVAEARPWSADPPAWPLLAYAVLVAIGGIVAVVIASRRDLGDGVLAPRPGPAEAGVLLHGPWQLAWRLVRGGAIAWAAGLMLFAFGFGLVAEEMDALLRDNPQLGDVIGQGLESLAALLLLLVSLGAAAAGLHTVGILAGEESPGRTGLVLAAPVSRWRWWMGIAFVAGVQVTVTLLASAAAVAAAMVVALDDNGWWGVCLDAAWTLLPGALVLTGLTLLAAALHPAARHLGWLVLVWALLVGAFGELLEIPSWTASISPWEWLGRVPVEAAQLQPAWAMAGVALAAAMISASVFSRRQLLTG